MLIDWKQGFIPSAQTSAGIRMIRPLLILFITFAHFSILDHYSRMNSVAELDFDNWLMVFLKASLARSGVPLLSLISGYLAVVSLERYGYLKVLLRKARRLVWPLFWANLLFIVLITYPEQARDPGVRPDLQIYPFDLMGWFQATFAFYKIPANEPLYFLKDLFTCFLLLPLLLVVARIKYLNVLVIAWMAYKCIYLKSAFIFEVYPLWFMRFDIVFAFYIGILLNSWKKDLLIVSLKMNLGLILLFLLATSLASAAYVVLAKPEHLTFFLWADFVVKVCSVLGCIAIMSLLAAHRGKLSRLLEWLSPYAYTLFLTHLFTFTFFSKIYLHYFPTPDFFRVNGILYIVMMLLMAVLVSIALKKLWSGISARSLRGRKS
jgi:peptidoglycan/LPS O-acetylase OafA/YrhL